MKAIALLSGGIDSPVAAHRAITAGMDVTLLHFNISSSPIILDTTQSIPVEVETDWSERQRKHRERITNMASTISALSGRPIPLYAVPFAELQNKIRQTCRTNLTCVICKRMMLRFAAGFARKEGASYIIMGDSLGQVASQTISNLRTETVAADGVIVLRPNIGLDKQEIIDMAKKIGTYEISIQKDLSCQALPPKVATVSKITDAETDEKKISPDLLVDEMLRKIERWL
ncbi:MAG: 7-cyano-7-deazaguanine synthase [Thermoplasmata archaeon]